MAQAPGTIHLGKFRVVYEEREPAANGEAGYLLQQRALVRLNDELVKLESREDYTVLCDGANFRQGSGKPPRRCSILSPQSTHGWTVREASRQASSTAFSSEPVEESPRAEFFIAAHPELSRRTRPPRLGGEHSIPIRNLRIATVDFPAAFAQEPATSE